MKLKDKTINIKSLFPQNPEFVVYPYLQNGSQDFYRNRIEFAIKHFDDKACFVMFDEQKQPYQVTQSNIANRQINALMPQILALINSNKILSYKLFQVDFLTTSTNQALVTLCYHKALDDSWQMEACKIADSLNINIIGRSRKQKLVLGNDFVTEAFIINGKTLQYKQVENCFTQPNSYICQQMLSYVTHKTQHLQGDLLELYCGIGNFTLALASNFNKILATEINKTSLKTAIENAQNNDINNIDFVRLSAQETFEALHGKREFNRLKHLDLTDFNFSTILVDPPRSGVGEFGCRFMQEFDHIIYISCNYETLFEDMKILQQTHQVVENAIFDQFPNTKHTELTLILERR
jgi:tRNA (uracil-5-)-methyltransferase